jgi:hypothetical protein
MVVTTDATPRHASGWREILKCSHSTIDSQDVKEMLDLLVVHLWYFVECYESGLE